MGAFLPSAEPAEKSGAPLLEVTGAFLPPEEPPEKSGSRLPRQGGQKGQTGRPDREKGLLRCAKMLDQGIKE